MLGSGRARDRRPAECLRPGIFNASTSAFLERCCVWIQPMSARGALFHREVRARLPRPSQCIKRGQWCALGDYSEDYRT